MGTIGCNGCDCPATYRLDPNGTHGQTWATPNWPSNYPPNLNCEWNFEATTGKLQLEFNSPFSLQDHSKCRKDYVLLSNRIKGADKGKVLLCGEPTLETYY